MVLKCLLQKPFGVGYRACPVTGAAVVAEVKGNAARESGVVPKLRLLEIEGRAMEHLQAEEVCAA